MTASRQGQPTGQKAMPSAKWAKKRQAAQLPYKILYSCDISYVGIFDT